MHITVYLGASCGTDPHLAQAVRELGAWIGAAGHTLVYGGSKTGLMGLLAQSALEQGGSVIGVEPECFMAQDLQYDGLTQLIVTRSMAERKAKMIQLGDAFIAFPGGTGTLEEITEVMSQVSLGQLSAPCILYDLDGYYCHPLCSKAFDFGTKKSLPTGRLFLMTNLLGNEGQQSDLTGTLDGLGQLTLMHSTGTGGTAGQDLGALADEAAQLGGILIIDMLALIHAELANLTALTAVATGRSIFTFHSHGKFLLIKISCALAHQNGRSPSSSSISAKSDGPPTGAEYPPAGAP